MCVGTTAPLGDDRSADIHTGDAPTVASWWQIEDFYVYGIFIRWYTCTEIKLYCVSVAGWHVSCLLFEHFIFFILFHSFILSPLSTLYLSLFFILLFWKWIICSETEMNGVFKDRLLFNFSPGVFAFGFYSWLLLVQLDCNSSLWFLLIDIKTLKKKKDSCLFFFF